MSEKTEKPTEQKKREAARKGQVFHPSDLCTWLTLCVGIAWLTYRSDLSSLLVPLRDVIVSGFSMPLDVFVRAMFDRAARVVVPLCAVVIVLPSLLTLAASRFELATEALVPDFNRLNPIEGVKRVFSRRTAVGTVCALAYCFAAAAAVWIASYVCGRDGFASIWLAPSNGSVAWRYLLARPAWLMLACMLPVCLVQAWGERSAHTHDLLMEKHEVQRERRDHEGRPEVKTRRRDLFLEMLDAQSKHDIGSSNFVLANPTHLAVGIYVDDTIVEWPFVSIREKNRRALAVIAYAESIGIPVIRDKRLTRAVFGSTRRYGFVDRRFVERILHVVAWLKDVECARSGASFVQDEELGTA
ncbi:EscU/YscU/HrcU family type III secretion system export apparatus switch protein [Pararobbsia silviterrae]|nr:EscU/YscU/HrcU family type III secretion system export apparatus switch protein [Pararobbsia silviterrae]